MFLNPAANSAVGHSLASDSHHLPLGVSVSTNLPRSAAAPDGGVSFGRRCATEAVRQIYSDSALFARGDPDMCVAFWTLDDPEFALILCANRDEFLVRPAHPAALHTAFAAAAADAKVDVLSGRDVQAGGTWLGLAPAIGRAALLTNITEIPPSPPPPKSRGALVPAFLGAATAPVPLEEVFPPDPQYAGFNLLVLQASREEGEGGGIRFDASLVSNGGAGGRIAARTLRRDERVVGGLSNGLHVDVNAGEQWPKVALGRAMFQEVVAAAGWREAFSASASSGEAHGTQDSEDDPEMRLAEKLFALLRTPPEEPPQAREDLRKAICVPPLGLPTGRGYYATRTATVLLVRRDGRAVFVERDVWRVKTGEPGADMQGEGEVAPELNEGTGEGGQRVFRVRVEVPAA
ncbi:hypothetical protein MKEN_00953000 [Mycena kentingensis (nom. inval.)]|nr:hypothetical protein MKEN_00953000 [Mycena kentingensis (nom. inval.)]